ncbi:multidrug resistance-associated ABC transporter [Trametes coccinea BRFM310]|uniref:Multidrug resistance-associated ABC transporter n=1 Tax=Trametes coccinea (strain BRFM310) TaxID=1353009 RepID=A0A1Y2IWV7_TRAC3|nr:multidrug resistance-associated ABC transporter [Trametes coccinea BRFM310]
MAAAWHVPTWLQHSQVVLDRTVFLPQGQYLSVNTVEEPYELWKNTLAYPATATVLSAFVLSLQLLSRASPIQRLYAKVTKSDVQKETGEDLEAVGTDGQRPSHIQRLGGPVIFAFKAVRLLSTLALLALSIASIAVNGTDVDDDDSYNARWVAFAITGTYAYASLLAFISVISRPSLSNLASKHVALVLLATWAVYFYRDLWPLATFTLQPVDAAEGAFLWVKLSLLTLAAVLVPLFCPRPYVPVDPKDPMPEVNPEQTASLFSMSVYTFLDGIIFKAYRMPHLPFDELPPLADYDYAKNLVKRSFPYLDPFQVYKHRHIFFGLLQVFRREYLLLSVLLLIRVAATFASPLGIYRLLDYLETDGENATVRPWVWISWLFLGPVLGAVAIQYYVFNTTQMLVQTEAIITQLVFDHALRIRMKSDSPESPSASRVTTAVHTPDNASIAEGTNGEHASGSGSNGSEDETLQASSTSVASSKADKKGKASKKDDEKPATAGSGPSSGNLIGRINNLVTTDLSNLVDGRDFLFIILYAPAQIIVSIIFLYEILGWSAFVGLVTIILLFPIPGYIASLIQNVQTEKMKKTDARVQDVTETMNVIRMIKLFGWEPKVTEQLTKKREDELKYIKKYKILELINGNINYVIPVVTMVATFVTYTIIMGKELTASRVFSSMSVFDVLREQLHVISGLLPSMIQAKVSLDRVSEFLNETELLDEFNEKDAAAAEMVVPPRTTERDVIGIRAAAFTWSNQNDGTMTPGPNRRNFTLRIEDDVIFKRGKFNLIVGPTGSGKTSLLMALLGELHYIPTGPDSFVSLPRSGGVAYAAQESWVQNETIRDNILFGAPYDEERYNKVIYQCALKRDLTLFEAGDKTEVGEKGLTLSGGQKARITLARAVYSNAEILLLDDVLAALDVHTARWIVDKCFKGDLLRGRTVLLVTHNVAMASPIADHVVSLGTDGRIASQGTLSKVLAKDEKLLAELSEEEKELKKADAEVDHVDPDDEAAPKKADGKLVVAEEIAEGRVSWPALRLYLSSMGGTHAFIFWLSVVGFLVICELTAILQTYWLGYWAQQYEDRDQADVNVFFYLSVYNVLLTLGVVAYCVSFLVHLYGSLRASRSIHTTLLQSVLHSTLRWLDKTPTSRIITRCTQDIQCVDGPLATKLGWVIELTVSMLMKFLAVVSFSPIFTVPGAIVAALGGWCGQIYMKAQLSVKREMSNARAPVLGHFGAAIAGLTSIRAYGAQSQFRQESYRRIDKYVRAARTFYNLNRWVSVRIESLGALFAACLAAYLVYGSHARAASTGFSLNMAVGFAGIILWWIRILNEFEVNGNSLERIQQYVTIEQEPLPTTDGMPPAYWPASGSLRVEKLSARYTADGPRVLHEISFDVKAGERVGIVGRTGSGKSSLTLALLRLIFTEGKVYYDGIATDSINLDALRSNITIIPQVPELLSGTLRQNLDPFSQYDDAVLNDALRAAGLFSLQNETDEGRITLDSQISSGGSNLSVGQRQILALARAIVRQSKLLILDEATSAIDYETDTIIQTSLRQELGKDVTILTIAHRLQTIMDADKILVLDAGHIAEFGAPHELLKNEKGMLRSLVDESGDRDALYAMAKAAATSH